MLGNCRSDLGTGAVTIVGSRLNYDCYTTRTITLVGNLFVDYSAVITSAFFDGAFNISGRHVGSFGLTNC